MRWLTGVGRGWWRQLAHYIDTHEGLDGMRRGLNQLAFQPTRMTEAPTRQQ